MSEENSNPEVVQTPQQAPQQDSAPAPTPATPSAGKTNGLAIAALIVGIVAVLSGWAPFWGVLVGAAAIVLGVLGLKKGGGKGMSIAGIITGAVGALWGLLVTVLFIIALGIGTAAVQTAQNAVEESKNQQQSLIDSKKDFAKGSTAVFGETFEVKVTGVEKNFNAGEYVTPATGKHYIKVDLSVKNISDETEYVSTYTFDVLDAGLVKGPSFAENDSELESGYLTAGATITGSVVYEVTIDASDLKLVYKETALDPVTFDMKELTYTLAF